MSRYWSPFPEYVPVAERRARAQRAAKKLAAKGRAMHPVVIEGRTIARSFWGKAWCDNIEAYRDFAYRLERGRSYVRSGAVIDVLPYGALTVGERGEELADLPGMAPDVGITD